MAQPIMEIVKSAFVPVEKPPPCFNHFQPLCNVVGIGIAIDEAKVNKNAATSFESSEKIYDQKFLVILTLNGLDLFNLIVILHFVTELKDFQGHTVCLYLTSSPGNLVEVQALFMLKNIFLIDYQYVKQ
ncbi:2498_t:CDS:2 [Funneliformis geosporum]|uniref:2498_t:CDS:1 n=1 Tax=Funneliformis geosporum TaxID=1117311 RepID=A0A9W4WR66_9GLOM|nr:2498_t:CDS:2 [Funneliformis geosporum]